MRAVLFALLAAVGLGQAGQDARPLLTQVRDASRNLTTYRAEGRIAQDLDIGLRIKEGLAFRVAVRSPQFLRIEMSGVRKWRFNPATEDGRPVKGTAVVVVRFSLPDERPTRPSPRPVARPTPPPRSTLPEIVLKPPGELDSFFYVAAINFKAPAVCDRINESVDGGGSSSAERGHQIRSMRSSCYRELATLLHDANLCDKVVFVRTEMLGGSRLDRSECLSGLNGSSTVEERREFLRRVMALR